MNNSFSISFILSRPSESTGGIKLEQKDWEPFTGKVSAANMVRALGNLMYGSDYQPDLNCEFGDGQMVTAVYAFPYGTAIPYNIDCSYGTLGPRITDHWEVPDEFITFNGTDSIEVDYPIDSHLEVEWLGTVYTTENETISTGSRTLRPLGSPQIASLLHSFENMTLTINRKIYASARIKYRTVRHSYSLVVPAREDAIENTFSSVVYAVFNGGIEWLSISPAPGYESYDAECGYGYGNWANAFEVVPEPFPQHPSGEWNRTIEYDYCSGELNFDDTPT